LDEPPQLQKRNPGVTALSLPASHTQVNITHVVLHPSAGPPHTAMNLMVY
jgi:hypothetical protein